MADVFPSEKRSDIMRQVKSTRNKSTEMRLIAIFKEKGIKGWRRNYPIVGKPDFVFLTLKTSIFVDGCFWHGHDCRNTRPKANADFWDKKRARNQQRDLHVTEQLLAKGWTVIRLWECELKKGTFEEKLSMLKPRNSTENE